MNKHVIKSIDMNDKIAVNEHMIEYYENTNQRVKAIFMKCLNEELKNDKNTLVKSM